MMLIGHLVNPQVCGMGWSDIQHLNYAKALVLIEAVTLSGESVQKASKE